MRVADAVAEWLEQKGINQAFGIVGGGNISLFDAINKRRFTHVCAVHHEQAAAMAAIYYWRTCGRLAVVLCTTGAGSSNAITGVIAAHMDGIPLLVISGNESSIAMRDKTRIKGVQGYDSSGLMAPILENRCYRMFDISCAGFTLCSLEHAYQNALTPRYGACWFDLSKDIANAPYLG